MNPVRKTDMIKTIPSKLVLVMAMVPFLAACASGEAAVLTPPGTEQLPPETSPTDQSIPAAPAVDPTVTQGFPKSTLIPTLDFPGPVEPVGPVQVTLRAGEVPAELIEKMQADLAKRLGVELSDVQVVKAQAVIWNDSSFGCPQPEGVYTEALVNGYWVIFRVGAVQYDYRASDEGIFILCAVPIRLIK